MSYIIVTRNPRSNKLVVITEDDEVTPMEFDALEEAEKLAKIYGYEVLEVTI